LNLHDGQSVTEAVTFDEALLGDFIRLSGDAAPVHTDTGHARALGFPARVVHGFLVSLPYSRLMGMQLPGPDTVIHSVHLDMVAPVFVGDTIVYTITVQRMAAAARAVVLALEGRNAQEVVVSRGTATCVFRR
jgi:3-hydroxybutyryl-CoA dehydratase